LISVADYEYIYLQQVMSIDICGRLSV